VVLLSTSGVQLVFLGILGEYRGRMFNETKRRPLYLVQDLVGSNGLTTRSSWKWRTRNLTLLAPTNTPFCYF
jgi:hypothetical protein